MKKTSFSFEYGGYCIWENGGAIKSDTLPVSDNLKKELIDLCYEFDDHIDWYDGSCLWTKAQCICFF